MSRVLPSDIVSGNLSVPVFFERGGRTPTPDLKLKPGDQGNENGTRKQGCRLLSKQFVKITQMI